MIRAWKSGLARLVAGSCEEGVIPRVIPELAAAWPSGIAGTGSILPEGIAGVVENEDGDGEEEEDLK